MSEGALSHLNIVIVGAGIAGSCAALALCRRGARVTLLERAAHSNEVGAGLQIPSCATRVLRALGLGEQLAAIASTPAQLHFREAYSGRLVINGAPDNDQSDCPHYQAHREDLHALLLDAAVSHGADVEWGARVVSVQQENKTVVACLESGNELRGDLLIGADGIRSLVRQQLFGDGFPQFTGNIAYRAMIDASRLSRTVAPGVFLGPDAHFVIYPLRQGRVVNVVAQCRSDQWLEESWTTPADVATVRHIYQGWHDDVDLLLSAMDETYKWALYTRPPMPRWSVGRIGLIGDACHPSLPNLGAGAAMAMEDAFVLTELLAKSPNGLEAALDTLYQLRIKRCTRVQQASKRNAELFHINNPLRRWLSYRALSLLTQTFPGLIATQLRWLQEHDATKVVSVT